MTRTPDMLWNILLALKKKFDGGADEAVSVVIGPEGFRLHAGNVPRMIHGQHTISVCTVSPCHCRGDTTLFYIDDHLTVSVLQDGFLNQEEIGFMSNFLPYCVMSVLAFKRKRAISIIHLAQSIDGRMATLSHNSKWISNMENLTHVHRMRALSDGILVGARTLQNDKPALTVRFVGGPNPAKIVIGNSAWDFASILASGDRVIHLVSRMGIHVNDVETVLIREDSGFIRPEATLENLYKLGINSVYIEGGSYTTSRFIREQAVDLMNFYIAPLILGSGISLEFQGIARIEDALSLQNCRYLPMGDGMLITGQLKHAII